MRAELDQARASGELVQRGQTYGSFVPQEIGSTRSRAEAIAELKEARRSGRYGRTAYGSFGPDGIASSRSRAEVIAELQQAQAAGRRLRPGARS